MALKITNIRKRFMDRRDKHGLNMKMALTKVGSIFKVKKHR